MSRPAVFFDRDNTLIVSDGYLGDPAKVVLVDGAAGAVARARRLGYAAVVFSNQSGVARGLFDEEAVHAVNARMDALLMAADPEAIVDRHEFCPFHPEAEVPEYRQDSPLRKPAPGMIHSAAARMDLDIAYSWVIGDAPRDIEAGKAAGCRTILYRDLRLPPSPAASQRSAVRPDYMVSDLGEAMRIIEEHHARERAQATPPPLPAPVEEEMQVREETPPLPPPEVAPIVQAMLDRPLPPEPPAPVTPKPALPEPALPPDPPPAPLARTDALLDQILQEVRHHGQGDFSVAKLLAGIVQVLVLACLFFAYLHRGESTNLQSLLLLALTLQAMTIGLLLMGR